MEILRELTKMSRAQKLVLPQDLETLRKRAERAIAPIKPSSSNLAEGLDYWLAARRTDAGDRLPPHYLVYFLLVELLGFRNLGRGEKVAWVIPIGFESHVFTIEYRKMGIGVFTIDAGNKEQEAERIVSLIKRGVSVSEPYFEWLALEAINKSELNVTNAAASLFARYEYLKGRYEAAEKETSERKDERRVRVEPISGHHVTTTEFPWYELKQSARWLALSTIDAFFSWTEHVFVHLAILLGRATTGQRVTDLADANWHTKFKSVLDISVPETKRHFDKLSAIRRQHRNFMTHGAFGKQGEAFKFHSKAGAVPVLTTHRPNKGQFSLSGEPVVDEGSAIKFIEAFIGYLWSGRCAPARIYLQESGLPTILTMSSDGTYADAMQSEESMQDFVEGLTRQFDNAANMDW
jgi:hypothetical protein